MGRGSSGAKAGISASRSVNNSQVEGALKSVRAALGSGNGPSTITVNGLDYKQTSQKQYESNGGYIVHSYVYRSQEAPAEKSVIEFRATDYMTPEGVKHPDTDIARYSRMKPKIWGVKISRGTAYSYGNSR